MGENRAQITASTLCKFLSLNPTDFYEDVVKSDVKSLCTEILKRSPNGSSVLSNDEAMKWIAFADSFPLNSEECTASFNGLNDELAQKSVLGNNFKISEVDVIVYSVIHSCLIAMSSSARKKFTNVLRWAYYVQDKVDLGEILEKIPIEKLKFEPPTKKPETKAASKDDDHDPICLLNIQVGLICKAQKHPSADSLLVKEIDVGESKVRQVVSGLGKFYSPDDLLNRRVILITNLKPAMFKGTVSEGLVLCAFNEDRSVVELLLPPESAKVGERVTFSGHVGKPEDVLDPRKKLFEKITPHVFTDDNGVATYKGIPFMTSAGPCTSSIRKGNII